MREHVKNALHTLGLASFKRALSTNTAFKDYLGNKQLDFQIHTQSGKGRFFSLHNSGIHSKSITNKNSSRKPHF